MFCLAWGFDYGRSYLDLSPLELRAAHEAGTELGNIRKRQG